MRWHSNLLLCVVASIIAVSPSPALAKGGKGGGKGGGRPSFSGGRGGGGGGGGPKLTQQPAPGGNHVADGAGKAADKPSKDKLAHQPQASKDKPSSPKDGGSPTNSGEAYNKKQKQLEIEQRNRDKRLAQAEHLREIAERTGNENLAANADRMEAFAHDHYARRVSQLEKFGVSDPTLDPGVLTDPLLDPAGEFAELPLLP